jgi:hypothetical protein
VLGLTGVASLRSLSQVASFSDYIAADTPEHDIAYAVACLLIAKAIGGAINPKVRTFHERVVILGNPRGAFQATRRTSNIHRIMISSCHAAYMGCHEAIYHQLSQA